MPKLESLLLKILTGLVSILAVSFVSWATWATVAIFTLQKDIAIVNDEKRLSLKIPRLTNTARPPPILAYPSLSEGLFMQPPQRRR